MKTFILKPSIYLTCLISLIFISAISYLAFTTLPLLIKILLIFISLIPIIKTIKQNAWQQQANAIIKLQFHEEDSWVLSSKNGESWLANIQAHSVVTRYIIILNFKNSDRKKSSVILLPDSLDKNSFRRLRVLLRFNK